MVSWWVAPTRKRRPLRAAGCAHAPEEPTPPEAGGGSTKVRGDACTTVWSAAGMYGGRPALSFDHDDVARGVAGHGGAALSRAAKFVGHGLEAVVISTGDGLGAATHDNRLPAWGEPAGVTCHAPHAALVCRRPSPGAQPTPWVASHLRAQTPAHPHGPSARLRPGTTRGAQPCVCVRAHTHTRAGG